MIWIHFIGTMVPSPCAVARVKLVYRRYNQGTVRTGITGGELQVAAAPRSGGGGTFIL